MKKIEKDQDAIKQEKKYNKILRRMTSKTEGKIQKRTSKSHLPHASFE
jgi:hypothetical protein